MATDIQTGVVKFHLSLNSSDLRRSIDFYRVLFGREPTKVQADYAKFEVDEPPLVMSLIPTTPGSGGVLNHVGFRLTDSETLVAMQARLEQAGFRTQREEGVECCYSKQTKFWVTDPDRTLWELYVLHHDTDEHGSGSTPETVVSIQQMTKTEPAPRVVWQHLLTQPLPERIPHETDSVDSVGLQGTFNMHVEPQRRADFLREVARVLKPGGTATAHHLSADRPLAERPRLPGPAALVEQVLVESAGPTALAEAGLVNVEVTKLGAQPCFTVGCVQLRETKILGFKPSSISAATVEVLYKGPLNQVGDDLGNIYPRGQRIAVSATAAELLKQGSAAEQFVFFASAVGTSGACCG